MLKPQRKGVRPVGAAAHGDWCRLQEQAVNGHRRSKHYRSMSEISIHIGSTRGSFCLAMCRPFPAPLPRSIFCTDQGRVGEEAAVLLRVDSEEEGLILVEGGARVVDGGEL